MSLTAVIREQQRRSDLANFGGAQHDAHRLALQLEQFFQRGDDAHKVRGEHALQHPAKAESGQKHLLGREHLHPFGFTRPDAALHVAVVVVVGVFAAAAAAVDHGRSQHGFRHILVVVLSAPVFERGHFRVGDRVNLHVRLTAAQKMFSGKNKEKQVSTAGSRTVFKKDVFDFLGQRVRFRSMTVITRASFYFIYFFFSLSLSLPHEHE